MRGPAGRRRTALLRAARGASSWAEVLAAKMRRWSGGWSCPPHGGEGAL
jgi:hypothetical protein